MMFTDDNKHLVAEFRSTQGLGSRLDSERFVRGLDSVPPQVFVFDCLLRPSYLLVGPLNARRTWMIGPDEVNVGVTVLLTSLPTYPNYNPHSEGSKPEIPS